MPNGWEQKTIMTYSVKEAFLTLQGEGAHSGRAAVFLRFAGCNLWTGREQDRAIAICQFCDTDFIGTNGINGGKFETASDLAKHASNLWGSGTNKYIVCTGGEPLLQLDEALIDALHNEGFEIAIESNGTIAANPKIDWICISPKIGSELIQTKGHELKFVYPQKGAHPSQFEKLDFQHFFVQPLDADNKDENLKLCIEFCMANPKWRLSLQTHKMIGIL